MTDAMHRALAELAATTVDWPIRVVEQLVWVHWAGHPECTGFAMQAGCRAWCGACGWRVDPREGADPDARARFALGTLARLGDVITDALAVAGDPALLAAWARANDDGLVLEAAEDNAALAAPPVFSGTVDEFEAYLFGKDDDE